ncbi:hypothetical protein SAMN04488515_1455 [Cognatiyoonia koreensis]|uniref:Nitroreductase family protein n=1 Tax=Cognatiyoonia koreensis TaxID=364200 RepID=A0A1I0PVE1_9RHOB|nr:hypothetical protein [Cognatiyoonia koreensis]SEW18314.1 hypothetical protein SAMN04488515_1455 [Cognatiyoonia koreensis]
MLDHDAFERIVTEANQAPSVHNAQPARWRLQRDVIEVAADLSVQLPEADPDQSAIGLSCGAAVEATMLACTARGFQTHVVDHWDDNNRHTWRAHRLAAQIYLSEGGRPDALYDQLGARFTWRSNFEQETPRLFGWTRQDTTLVLDAPTRTWFADHNDTASLAILNRPAFRRELLSWIRLDPVHPRWSFDGLSREALLMPKAVARKVRLGFGPLWSLLRLTGGTKALTAERAQTLTAPVIAAFHVPAGLSATEAGRAYLRLWLEATRLGFAGWPMAALTDHAPTRAAVAKRLNIGADRRLVQVIRFGKPTGPRPPRARRPIAEIMND